MAVGSGYYKTSHAAVSGIYDTRFRKFWLCALVLALILLPFSVGDFYLRIVDLVLFAILGAQALNLLTGIAGQISLGNAAFLAIGAASAAVLGGQAHLPFLVVVFGGGIVAALVGLAVGIPALRLRGLYLVIATLALHYIVIYVIQRYQTAQAGARGFVIPVAAIAGHPITTNRQWYVVFLISAVLVTLAFTNLLRGVFGRAWLAVGRRDVLAEVVGIDVARYKVLAFVVSAFVIGIQGALYAYFFRVVDVESFTLDIAIQYVAMVIIGGLGSILGSVIGATFVVALPYVVQNLVARAPAGIPGMTAINRHVFDIEVVLYGLSIVLFLLLEPRGLADVWVRLRTYIQLWPFRRELS